MLQHGRQALHCIRAVLAAPQSMPSWKVLCMLKLPPQLNIVYVVCKSVAVVFKCSLRASTVHLWHQVTTRFCHAVQQAVCTYAP
jgi:hypothetical protein